MNTHSFDVDDAKRHGVIAATILYNIRFWTEKNAANERHQYDGRIWTYNSIKAFEILLPYLSAKQIKTALRKLEESGEIVTGNYNKSAYDRTKWYAISDQAFMELSSDPIGSLHLPSGENGMDPEGQPIPDINTDINTDKNTPIIPLEIDEAVSAWNTFAACNDLPKVQKLTKARQSKLQARLKDAGGIAGWNYAIALAGQSDFLMGRSGKGWAMTFDFLCQESSFIKLMEGGYANRDNNTGSGGSDKRGRSHQAIQLGAFIQAGMEAD